MKGEVRCAVLPAQVHPTANTFKVDIYVVSDLAFYAMVLEREGMMGVWCYLCKLSHAEFQDLFKRGDAWAWDIHQQQSYQQDGS